MREESNHKKGNIENKLSFILRKRKLKWDNIINYNSNNPAKESGEGGEGSKGSKGSNSLRPQKQ